MVKISNGYNTLISKQKSENLGKKCAARYALGACYPSKLEANILVKFN